MDEVSQIRQKIDIVPLISEYVTLKKMGRNFKGLCPFHTERTPSFVVSPERQIFHCFGCNVGGDVFSFLMQYEKLEFVEALRMLAKRAGVTLKQRNIALEGVAKKKDRLYEINHLAAEFYHYLLTKHDAGEGALAYLKKRGITQGAIKSFKLGFAPTLSDGLIRFLVNKKKFALSELEDAGLVIKDRLPFDRFRNRIMFPLADHRGNLVGFSGRILTSDQTSAKYVNTPETLVYHKGDLLFGLDKNKDAIKKEDFAVLVEGEFDVIQGFIHGIPNMLAIKGTAVTEAQVNLLKRFTEKVSICLDSDQAGISAQWRGIGILEDKGMLIHVIEIPSGKDPDESLRQNPREFLKAVKKQEPVYDFLIKSATERFNPQTPEGKKKMSGEVLPFLARIQNEIIKDHYVKRLAEALGVSAESIEREMDRVKKTSSVGIAPKETAILSDVSHKRTREEVIGEYLIALILQSNSVSESFREVQKIIGVSMLQASVQQKIFSLLESHVQDPAKQKTPFSIKDFVEETPEELHFAIDRAYLLSLPLLEDEGRMLLEIEKTATEVKALFLKSQMRDLTLKIKQEEEAADEGKLLKLKEEFNTLLKTLRLLTITTLEA